MGDAGRDGDEVGARLATTGSSSAHLAHMVVVRAPSSSRFDALGAFERRGLHVVGLASDGGELLIALRCADASAAAAVRSTCAALTPPASATPTQQAALEQLHRHFYDRPSLAHWETEEDAWVAPRPTLLGTHGDNPETFALARLLAPGADGSAEAARFCAQLRRDSYVPVLLGPAERELVELCEASAHAWFEQDEDAKLDQAGVYAHIDRKFVGYRQGKFREQLELRATKEGGFFPPLPGAPSALAPALSLLTREVDGWARGLLRHVGRDLCGQPDFFEPLLDPPLAGVGGAPPAAAAPAAAAADLGARVAAERARLSALPTPPPQPDEDDASYASWVPPALRHSLVRACRYDAESAGVCGGGVLCEAHNDVGFLTFDACAATPGLEALRRADGLWVPVEEAAAQPGGELVLIVMVGDTLGYLTKDYYTPCRHRVVRPPDGARIGLPFLFRGRSDAVLNTRPALDAAAAAGRRAHLAEMETTTIKELPAFASAKSILRNWFKSVKA